MQKLMAETATKNLLMNLITATNGQNAPSYNAMQIQNMFSQIRTEFMKCNNKNLLDKAKKHFKIAEWTQQHNLSMPYAPKEYRSSGAHLTLLVSGRSQNEINTYLPNALNVNNVAKYLLRQLR